MRNSVILGIFCLDGDVEAAVTARIRSGWFKFRSLASYLTVVARISS